MVKRERRIGAYARTSAAPNVQRLKRAMAKKKPVVVTITEGKHKTQPWSVRIEQGKTDTILSQRYTRLHSAKMGAMRKLKAMRVLASGIGGPITMPDGRTVEFVVKPKTTKSK